MKNQTNRLSMAIKNRMSWRSGIFAALMASVSLFAGCGQPAVLDHLTEVEWIEEEAVQEASKGFILFWNREDEIPAYSGAPWSEVHGGVPYFSKSAMDSEIFESYSDLDGLGRCGQAYANICGMLMPTKERGQIGQVKPSGWHTVKYPEQISDLYLYNRCHLIGYQLAGENANEKNLITGTQYLNIEGMLPFENEVADHVHETGHHVLYRVMQVFMGDNLVCRGVEMEASCIEDDGKTNGAGVCFHVFAYNVQPGIGNDYAIGDSWVVGDAQNTAGSTAGDAAGNSAGQKYAVNTNSMKFHLPDCASVKKAKPQNIKYRACSP